MTNPYGITNVEIAATLDQAADEIEKRGWTRGVFQNHKTGHVCMIGGVRLVSFDYRVCQVVEDAMRVQLKVEIGDHNIIDWNDKQRDKRKVIRFMRRTARKLRVA